MERRGARRLWSPLKIDDEGRTRKARNTRSECLGDDRQDAPDQTTHQRTMTHLVSIARVNAISIMESQSLI